MSEDLCALVTGGTRGIGRAVVLALLAHGRRVVACGRDQTALAELERAHPGRVLGLPVDLVQPGAPAGTVDQALARVGRLDELVYAAGVAHHIAAGDIDEQALRAQLELNFLAPFAMLQRAGAHMRARGAGAMVVVASTLASRPAPRTAGYAASKAALLSAARSFALELAPAVRVNAVSPGVVDTAMVRVPRRPLASGETREAAVERQLEELRVLHPLGRLGTPEDVAEAVLYLLEARWVTGSELTIDGGLTLR